MKKLVGAYGNKGKGREREVIPIPEGVTEVREVMALFGCSDWTARASLKRGFFIVDYLKRSICPGTLDPEAAYKMAWKVYRKVFLNNLPWFCEAVDVVQEGVTMLIEMAGHPRFQERKFQFYVALNGMKGFIERQRRLRGAALGAPIEPGYEEDYRETAGADWMGCWMAVRAGESPDTWGRSHRATEKMCRVIERKAA